MASKQKSFKKVKAEGTQEFFSKEKTKFTFNKAPVNKTEAKHAAKDKFLDKAEKDESVLAEKSRGKKRSAFVAKLYRDDDDLDEMKVLAGDNFDSEGNEDVPTEKKRDKKQRDKSELKVDGEAEGIKIGKLRFEKGSVALFAVSEVHKNQYAIVNHTRNVKGYIDLKENPFQLKVGQFVIAQVKALGTGYHNVDTSRNQNRKVQLTLEPKQLNKGLGADKVATGMVLQAIVGSREPKGYMVELGFKDGAKGFIKAEDKTLTPGTLVTIVVKSASSKLVKCEVFGSTETKQQTVAVDEQEVGIHMVKPGFLVNAKVNKLFENGLELRFLKGMTGTVFADHLVKPTISGYRVSEQVQARIISVDVSSKKITLSLLPHIIELKSQSGVTKVGQAFQNVKVEKLIFGKSFLVHLGKGLLAFLHKSNVKEAEEDERDEESKILDDIALKKKSKKVKKAVNPETLLQVGQTIPNVRVKEFNFFDGRPILSMKEDVLSASALDYDSLKVGDTTYATIDSVNSQTKCLTLKISDFVKGILPLEHMAEHPLKVIPPKLTEIGKQIKVRIFSIDQRTVTFTKKDTFMKDKCTVFASPSAVSKGDKVYGVVVGSTEYGLVLRSFGGVKGLLTFDDIKKSSSQKVKISDCKEGTILKAYVLFYKPDSGVALTLDKKKTKKDKKVTADDYLVKFGPNEEEMAQLKETYSSMLKESAKESLIGQTLTFRCVGTKAGYHVVKTGDKKAKVGILPKCLLGSFGITLPMNDPTVTMEGIVVEHLEGIPVIAVKHELTHGPIQQTKEDLEKSTTHVGFVGKVCAKFGVTVNFFNGLTVQVPMKDLQESQDISTHYKLGQVVSVTRNTKDRFTLKTRVLHKSDPQAHQNQLQTQIETFGKLFKASTNHLNLKIGQKVNATVQLVKDYGLIAAIEGFSDLTGFIVNEQKSSGKHYKVGSVLECIVLDIDMAKMIVDLSERLAESKEKDAPQGNQKAIVELNKEQYLIVTFKKARNQVGICIPNDFTQVNKTDLYAKYQVGSEISVRVVPDDLNCGFTLTIPSGSGNETGKGGKNVDIEEGSLVSGPLRSIKHNCLFVQIGTGKVPVIGRLHLVETFNSPEFDSFKVGDIITAKVLRKTVDNDRTWVELTRRKQHLSADKLDDELCRMLQLNTLKEGEEVEGMVTETVGSGHKVGSTPITVHVSAFVRCSLSFSNVISVADLQAGTPLAQKLAKKFKIGQKVPLVYRNGTFTLKAQEKTAHKVGNLVVCRFVKSIPGIGVTVQIDEKTFGMIQVCELTDEVAATVIQGASDKDIFPARIIGNDKKGRLQLSSRESVVDQEMWNLTKPDGSSAHFKTADAKRQANGNYRNAILKYGAKLILAKGSLVIGYVANISKAGCFIQVGHNTSVRAGLNELSDKQDFDFSKEMPLGRIVVARITKTDQDKNDNMRFHASLRHSLVVYGVDQIDFTQLKQEQEVSAIVLAVADGVAFGQIKGSYYKLKIKDVPSTITTGTVCSVKLQKVIKDKLTATYVGTGEETSAEQRQLEHRAQQIYASVQEEAMKDIAVAATTANSTKHAQATEDDLEQLILNQKSQTQLEEQIRDLEAIQELEEDAQMESSGDIDADENDSDAEEMQKIIQQSKMHADDSDESEEQSDEEAGESEIEESGDESMEEQEDELDEVNSSEDEEMRSANSDESEEEKEESKNNKKKSGKSALRSQITQEKVIRQKEAEMRSKEGAQPKTLNDFERLLIADQDQSYLWIQYMAFMLEKLDVEAARRVAERAVKSVSITAETDKLNIWIAYMNLENKFGTEKELQSVVKRAIEVNDRLKVYLQLINIYRQSDKTAYVEDIYKILCKKNHENLQIWCGYLEFLFEVRSRLDAHTFTPAKTILQRALQALPKSKHINIITKFGSLEYKHGQPESGRTMFEGVVTNYPKRMDVWSIYMDMEIKYGGGKDNAQQARHLFERGLALDEIKKKPKKMKLVFRKYMEFESAQGNTAKLAELRKRVEQYLEQAFKQQGASDDEGSGSGSEAEGSGSGEENEESGDEESGSEGSEVSE